MEGAGVKIMVNEQRKLKDLLDADWRRLENLCGQDESKFRWRSVFNPRFGAVALLRYSQALYQSGWGRSAKIVSFINFVIFNIEVPVSLRIGPGLVLPHPQGVILGAARIGSNVTIFQQVTLGAKSLDMGYDLSKRPTIEESATIAAGAKIIGGIVVGAESVVGANAVVITNVPAKAMAVGVPAKIKQSALSGS